MTTAGWTTKRVGLRHTEVFVSPEGVEYVRTTPGAAELKHETSVGALYLRRRSADQIKQAEARTARRLERRMAARRRQ